MDAGNEKHQFEEWIKVRSFLDKINKDCENDLKKFAEVYYVNSLLQVNFWVADNENAVFSIKSFEGTFYSYAFKTRDKHLISALKASWGYTKNHQSANGVTNAHELVNSS